MHRDIRYFDYSYFYFHSLFVASLQLQPRKETTSDPPENDDKQAEPKGRNVEMLVAARRCVNSVMAMVKTEGASSTEAASVKTEGASSRAATASGGREIIFYPAESHQLVDCMESSRLVAVSISRQQVGYYER